MSKNDGGPAFPMMFIANVEMNRATVYEDLRSMCGMSKRELFAAMAMQGILAYSPHHAASQISALACAEEAVAFADVLLEELQK